MLEMLTFKSTDSYQTLACSAAVHLSLTHVNRCQILNNTHLQITHTDGNAEVERQSRCFLFRNVKIGTHMSSKKSNLCVKFKKMAFQRTKKKITHH